MVLAKSKASSLAAVKNLNLWGNELSDVSIVRRTPNVEVLSLSVNNIKSLRDFAACPALAELYLRKNDIEALEEVAFLQARASPLHWRPPLSFVVAMTVACALR